MDSHVEPPTGSTARMMRMKAVEAQSSQLDSEGDEYPTEPWLPTMGFLALARFPTHSDNKGRACCRCYIGPGVIW